MQVVGRIRSSYTLQVHKVTSTRGEGFLFKKSSMCTNLLLIHRSSVTSRRGPPTSQRQFYMSLSRRDVDPHVATSIFTLFATSRRGFTHRDVNFYKPLSRRDVAHHVATLVAILSMTSRRHPARRDVNFYEPQSRRDVTPHVATLPCFKAKTSSFWLFTSPPPLPETLAILPTYTH